MVLFEASGELGGALQLANKAPNKFRIDNLIRWFELQIERDSNIEVRLNTPVTAENLDEVASLEPYAVVVASGGKQVVPGGGFPAWSMPSWRTMCLQGSWTLRAGASP